MALKSTIVKADLHVADMGRNYYHDHSLTIARHPSETEERMMMRVLAFALHADEALSFGNRMGTDDEPDLWQKDLTGAITLWIEVGQPDEKKIRRACGRAQQVFVYSYGGHSADVWREQLRKNLEWPKNLTLVNLPARASQDLAKLAQRSMQLQCTIQDGQIWITDDKETVHLDLSSAAYPAG